MSHLYSFLDILVDVHYPGVVTAEGFLADFSRRQFLIASGLASAAVFFDPSSAFAGGASWPSSSEWNQLRARVGSRLIQPQAPWATLLPRSKVPERLVNPWYLEEQPGATQSTGMYRAWTSTPSGYAVAAESADDIVAAINFARSHNVRLVVKGTGHDYFGRSSGSQRSLLIWTHRMRRVVVHDSFVPQGARLGTQGVPAVSTHAGNRWLEAYKAATQAGLYIQGGGCTSVGACGGFALGGGFGSFSKRFGSGAAGVLEMEVVCADGSVRVCNEFKNADLFWALKGGGGGTFGVVTRMTLLAHPIPHTSGWIAGPITAASDDLYRELIQRYLVFVRDTVHKDRYGEGVIFAKGMNTIQVGTAFIDMTKEEALAEWESFLAPLRERPADFTVELRFTTRPFATRWTPQEGEAIFDNRRNAPPGYFWWTGNASEVAAYWGGYEGRGVPWSMLGPTRVGALAEAIFQASRTSLVLWQTSKALFGEPADARARDEHTSMNPAVFNNVAFVTLGDWQQAVYPTVKGHEPDEGLAAQQFRDVTRAIAFIRDATPGGGSYSNEGSYFEQNWKDEFWGSNYPRLLRIKKKYDPTNLFRVHKGVGWDL